MARDRIIDSTWSRLLASVSATALALASCKASEVASDDEATYAASRGAELWAQNCVRCHILRPPSSFSDYQWEVILHHMRVRANLTAEEHREILRFLKEGN